MSFLYEILQCNNFDEYVQEVKQWEETDDGKRIMHAINNKDKSLLYTDEERAAYEDVVTYLNDRYE